MVSSSFLLKWRYSVLLKYCYLEKKKQRMNFLLSYYSVRMKAFSVVAFVSVETYKDKYGKIHMRKLKETLDLR